MKTNVRGFTLIELLVVISIIGILSAVVLASLNTARAKARDAVRMSALGQLQTALELYYSSVGHYPNDGASGTYAGCWQGTANWIPDAGNYNWSTGYIAKQPQDPADICCWPEGNCGSAGQPGTYEYWSNGSRYLISARLENTSSQNRAEITGVIDPRTGNPYATGAAIAGPLAKYCYVVTN